MIRIKDCIKIGKLGKPHGVNGAFTATLETSFFEDEEMPESFLILFQGYLVPFFLEEISLEDHKRAIVKFDHIHQPESAMEFVNCELYMTHKQITEEIVKPYFNDLEGYQISDKKTGFKGIVTELIINEQNPLIVAKINGKDVFIPFNESIIIHIDPELKQITTLLPDGLLDIND